MEVKCLGTPGHYEKGYIEKILSEEKRIESRFSKNRITPYQNILPGDMVYMQEVGKNVTATFKVKDVLFFECHSEADIDKIRAQYGKDICADDDFWELKKNAKYATLIFVADPKTVEPFKVYKSDRSAFKTVNSVKEELVINRRTIIKHPRDCERGKHYFVFEGHTHCRFCGCAFTYEETMRTRPDYQTVKRIMRPSMWNDEWLHVELDHVAKAKLPQIGRQDVRKRLIKSVGVCPADDGGQTPYYGNPVYYAQHGLGCCCRKCLEKFYGIPKDVPLLEHDLEYFTDLIMEYIRECCI